MRKLIFILFLFPLLLCGQSIYYIAPPPTGDNGNTGAPDDPWATLSYACSQVTSSGDKIHVLPGTYTEPSRCDLRVGVSIQGASQGSAIINFTYVSTSSSDACIRLYSASLTNGNQSITNLTITGSNFVATRAIWVGYRYGVSINNCTIRNFAATGVHFRNQINWLTPPVTYASGNSFYNNTVTNCSDRNYSSIDPGNLRIDGQENMNIYNCTFTNNARSVGHNGNTLNISLCRGIELYDCNFTKPDNEGGEWNFFGEIFHLRGGVEIRDCNFIGAAKLDFSNAADGVSSRGAYDFTASIHDNYFSTTTGNQISSTGIGHTNAAIEVEKGTWSYIYIYNNHIKSFPRGIAFTTATSANQSLTYFYIYNNKLENIGYTGPDTYTWAFFAALEPTAYTVTLDNFHVRNNTFTGGSGYNYDGIRWSANGTLTNSSFRNNIFYGFDHYPIRFKQQTGESPSFTNVDATYNCFYGNGDGNVVLIEGTITQTNVDITTGNISTNPLFTSDFHLGQGSPAIKKGVAPTLSSTDLDDMDWASPPSMGCYEYISASPPTATDYYVKNGGNDAAAGTSDATAWATVAKVNSITYIAGDRVFFKRGSTWREQLVPKSGTADAYMYYGAYGTGAKPLFLGSKEENSTDDWTEEYPNIWQSNDAAFTVDVGNIIFNGEASCGVKSMNISPTLDAQGKFWYSHANNWLWIYSTLNPATYYTDIECALMKDALYSMSGKQYITFQNLDFRYWGACVWSYGGNYLNFYDIDISYIGGADQNSDYSTRYGNGLQMWQGIRNITIERCKISNVYDAGISPQGYSGTYTAQNLIIRNNIINKCEYGFEFYFRPVTTATCQNVYFEHNTVTNSGGGWGHSQRPYGVSGQAVRIYNFTATKSNIYIRNNIFYGATERLFSIGSLSDLTNIVLDYNCYFTATGYVGRIGSTNYSSLATWQGAISQEVNAIGEDPLFVSPIDFHLRSTSPVIGEGVAVSGVALDFDLESYLNPPSIGAYEYTGGVEPEPGIRRIIKHNGKIVKNNGKTIKN